MLNNAPSPSQPLSVWQLKPWWCQPWSILLTGIGLIGGSWLLLHRLWLTLLVAIPVLIWMGFFIVLYPRAYAAMPTPPLAASADLNAHPAQVEPAAPEEIAADGQPNP